MRTNGAKIKSKSLTAGSCDGGASPLARRVVAGRGERNGAFRGTLTIVMRAPWKTVTPLLQNRGHLCSVCARRGESQPISCADLATRPPGLRQVLPRSELPSPPRRSHVRARTMNAAAASVADLPTFPVFHRHVPAALAEHVAVCVSRQHGQAPTRARPIASSRARRSSATRARRCTSTAPSRSPSPSDAFDTNFYMWLQCRVRSLHCSSTPHRPSSHANFLRTRALPSTACFPHDFFPSRLRAFTAEPPAGVPRVLVARGRLSPPPAAARCAFWARARGRVCVSESGRVQSLFCEAPASPLRIADGLLLAQPTAYRPWHPRGTRTPLERGVWGESEKRLPPGSTVPCGQIT